MSKVELAGRPEPGYESMEQFSVSVEHVAEMLRTIDFQPGEDAGRERPRAADRAAAGEGMGPHALGLHWVFLGPRRFWGGRG